MSSMKAIQKMQRTGKPIPAKEKLKIAIEPLRRDMHEKGTEQQRRLDRARPYPPSQVPVELRLDVNDGRRMFNQAYDKFFRVAGEYSAGPPYRWDDEYSDFTPV